MKLRSGFVSNSSTCSFLIHGIVEDYTEIMSLLKEKGILSSDIEDEGIWLEEGEGFKFFNNKRLEVETVYEGESLTIGRSWSSIRDDETGKQFKESIEAEIKELFGDKYKCETQEGQYPC